MPRLSPLGLEGTSLSYRDRDAQNRFTIATVRAKDEQGDWQTKRFAVTSWHRDDTPIVPAGAKDWAKATRTTFLKGEAVAAAATFQDFAKLLAINLESAGVSKQRADFIRTIARVLGEEGVTDMRRDTFPARIQGWIRDLQVCWSMPVDAKNRRKIITPLSPSSRNKVLSVCRQVTGLAIKMRRLPFDPLNQIPRFKQPEILKPLFTIDELRHMVSDQARFRAKHECQSIEDFIKASPLRRGEAIKALAKSRGCHWATIYNALARDSETDPWHTACCLLVFTGCRAQEAMAFRWEWIKWDAGIITLKLTDDYGNKPDAERLIPLEPELADILRPMAHTTGHILPPEIRAGGSGVQKREGSSTGKGAKNFTGAMKRYLHRIGIEVADRTAHSLRHCYITMKIARADMNVDRLRKAVGHKSFESTMDYGKRSQFFESEVDRWPDSTLWLRRPVPISVTQTKSKD